MSLIIVLNGTSSSGKTTLARALQERAGRSLLNFSLDTVLYTLPPRELARLTRGDDLVDVPYDSLVAGHFACVKELARAGLSLVVDTAVTARRRAEQLVEAVGGQDVLLVGVECPVEILERREAARGDRRAGLARAQSRTIHRWLRYDVVVNTEAAAPEDNALSILKAAASERRSGYAETLESLVAGG